MSLPVSLSSSTTLTALCSNVRTAVGDGKHEHRELRANRGSLYIKLQSAGCISRSTRSRVAHQRAVHVLLQDRLEASLRALGVEDRVLGVMASVLPVPEGATPRPVRVSDVYALERCVARIEKLIREHGLTPPRAVDLAIAFQEVDDPQRVDAHMLREAARHLQNREQCSASSAAHQVYKVRVTSHSAEPLQPADRQSAPGDAAPHDSHEMVLTLPAGLFAAQPLALAASGSSTDGKHEPPAEPGAPVPREFESRPPRSFTQRAERLRELARQIRGTPPGAQSADDLRELYAAYVPLAGSFTGEELLDEVQLQRLGRFVEEVQPLIDQSASTWSSLETKERRHVVATLRAAFHRHFETPTLNLEFTREPPPARISDDGATITLGLMQDQRIWRNFDQLVHQLIYGLTLGYQRELAQQVAKPGFATRSPQEQAPSNIMRALTDAPVTSAVVKAHLGYRPAAARAAEQENASQHHATVLADRVAAVAYGAGRTT